MPRWILVLLGASFLGLTGCGTFADHMTGPVDDHVYYRGVRLDIEAVKEGGPAILMAADIPFSAVVDTFLIPYYARTYRERAANYRLRSEASPRVPTNTSTPEPIRLDTRRAPEIIRDRAKQNVPADNAGTKYADVDD